MWFFNPNKGLGKKFGFIAAIVILAYLYIDSSNFYYGSVRQTSRIMVSKNFVPALEAVEKALSKHLSEDEKIRWYSGPWGSATKGQPEACPLPIDFASSFHREEEVDFTYSQKEELREKLEKGSKTIRDAFLPWIDKDGFHPDLILHGGTVTGCLVGIIGGKVYFSFGRDPAPKDMLLAQHLVSIVKEFQKDGIVIPDVIFPYDVGSITMGELHLRCAKQSTVPEHLQTRYESIITAGIATDPSQYVGVALLPNMYFGDMAKWDKNHKHFFDGGKWDVPWNKRKQQVFWRGKIANKLWANTPRVEAMKWEARDASRRPRLFDFALVDKSSCAMMKRHLRLLPESKRLTGKFVYDTVRCDASHRVGHEKFSNYWGQLNLPGSSSRSYSRNLQDLWPTGAAVLVWDQSAIEFYYDTLKAGVTHVWVDETNIKPVTLKLFENNGELAQLMGSAAKEWFKTHLTRDAIIDYYKQWFDAWSSLQRFAPTLDMMPNPSNTNGVSKAYKRSVAMKHKKKK